MIKKEIKYEDFDGNPVVETHYFHMSKPELLELENSVKGGYEAYLTKVAKSGEIPKMMQVLSDIISRAYGQREEGSSTRFNKSKELSEQFLHSLAYDALLGELMTSETAMIDLVNGLMPKDLMQMVAAQEAAKKKVAVSARPPQGSTTKQKRAEEDTPRIDLPEEQAIRISGLAHPYDKNHELLPWAFRDPTEEELVVMTMAEIRAAMQRHTNGWEAPKGVQ
jgi:hypothetical protein